MKNDPILIYYGLFFISIGLIESGYQGISAVGLFLLWITLAALIGFFHCYFFYLSTFVADHPDLRSSGKLTRGSEEVAWDERGWSRSGEEVDLPSPCPSPLAVGVLTLADEAWVGLPAEDLV